MKKLLFLLCLFSSCEQAHAVVGQFDSRYKRSAIIAYYKFDEGAGTTVNDKAGTAGPAIFQGLGNTWVSGRFGKAVDFNGTGDLDIANQAPFQNINDWTIMAWIKPRTGGPSTVGAIIIQALVANFYFGIRGFKVVAGASSEAETVSTIAVATNAWSCVAYQRNSVVRQEKCVFVNGVKDGCTVSASGARAEADDPEIGGNSVAANNQFDGAIGSFIMYNIALTDGEIEDMCGPGNPGAIRRR